MGTRNIGIIQKRLIGPCAENRENGAVYTDIESMVQRLILFDTYIMQSVRLGEIPQLVRTFGYDGLISLLNSKALQIYCSSLTLAESGNRRPRTRRGRREAPLPLGSYALSTIRLADDGVHISRCFSRIQADSGLTQKQFIKLKRVIADSLVEVPESAGDLALAQVDGDVGANSPMIKILVAKALQNGPGIVAMPEDFHLSMRLGINKVYESETNLGKTFGLDEKVVDGVVSQGLLGLGGFNWQIEQMRLFNALTGFKAEEMPFLGQKLALLAETFLSGKEEAQFQRICSLRGMPTLDVDQNGQIDAHKLLKIRNMKECEEFRNWLQGLQNVSDVEIEDKLNNLRTRIGGGLISSPGKVIRFLLPMLFVLFPPLDLAISTIDTFLLEHLFPYDGPASFVNQLYPSIFKQN